MNLSPLLPRSACGWQILTRDDHRLWFAHATLRVERVTTGQPDSSQRFASEAEAVVASLEDRFRREGYVLDGRSLTKKSYHRIRSTPARKAARMRKRATSGNKREQTFCPDCGSPIYSGPVGEGAKVVGLRVGTLRQRGELIPKDQYWFRSAQACLEHLPATKKRQKQPVFGPKGAFAD